MTLPTVSATTTRPGQEPAGAPTVPARGRRTRRWSSTAIAVGWAFTMVATIGVFVGGAGGLMLLAGQLTSMTITLATIGVASLGYLVWFLGIGPGRVPDAPGPSASVGEQGATTTARRRRSTTPLGPSACSFCGRTRSATNRIKASGRVGICERCIAASVGELSEYWAMRTEFRRASDRG